MATHPTVPPRRQLLEAINVKYRKDLEMHHVDFGLPRENSNSGSPFNSEVEITGAEGQPYEFTTNLKFDRLSLEAAFVGYSRTIAGTYTHSHELAAPLAELLKLPITAEDLTGFEIGVTYPQNLLLVAAPQSFLLIGQVALELTGP